MFCKSYFLWLIDVFKTEMYGSSYIFLLLFLPHSSYFQRRKLDAVYYYMRSLMASNPFQSARESLLSLFDESRKKVSNCSYWDDHFNVDAVQFVQMNCCATH